MGKKWEKTKEFCKEHAKGLPVAGTIVIGSIAGRLYGNYCDNKRGKELYNSTVDALKRSGQTTVRVYSPKEAGMDKPVAVIFKVIDDSMKES